MIKRILILLFLISFIQLKSQELINSVDCAQAGNQSVVSVKTYNSSNLHIGSGSGVIISNNGNIVTNYHVFKGGTKMIVNHQGTIYQMKTVLYKDIEGDILIFSIENVSVTNNFKAINFGDILNITKGERIYAIGNTFGLYENDNRITEGIISSTPRNMIEFSASINSGNSGGALINDNCELIGIITSKYHKSETIGYAIPINLIKNAILQSKNNTDFFSNNNKERNPNSYIEPRAKNNTYQKKEVMYSDGKYIGYFFNENKHGAGEYFYNDGRYYKGNWKNNLKDGYGECHYKSGVYKGDWQNDTRNGNGNYYFSNGDLVKGNFVNGNLNGYCEYYYKSGEIYKGKYINGKKNGFGVYSEINGNVYKGNWKNNLKDGYGEFFFADGSNYKGNWENDTLKKKYDLDLNKKTNKEPPPKVNNNKNEFDRGYEFGDKEFYKGYYGN